jgi:hypothetical protein
MRLRRDNSRKRKIDLVLLEELILSREITDLNRRKALLRRIWLRLKRPRTKQL